MRSLKSMASERIRHVSVGFHRPISCKGSFPHAYSAKPEFASVLDLPLPTTAHQTTTSISFRDRAIRQMADPCSQTRLYETQYEAVKLFNEGDMSGSMAAAQYNLTDSTLPPYYYIKNHILIASAMDDWEDAEHHRLAAVRSHTLPAESN